MSVRFLKCVFFLVAVQVLFLFLSPCGPNPPSFSFLNLCLMLRNLKLGGILEIWRYHSLSFMVMVDLTARKAQTCFALDDKHLGKIFSYRVNLVGLRLGRNFAQDGHRSMQPFPPHSLVSCSTISSKRCVKFLVRSLS